MTLFSILILLGAVLHLAGRLLGTRSEEGTTPDLIALVGALLTLASAGWVLTSAGVKSPPDDIAAVWGLCSGAIMLVGHRFDRNLGGGWIPLLFAAIGLGAAVIAAWHLSLPDRAALATTTRLTVFLTAGNGVLLAGGLAFMLGSLAFVSADKQLSHSSWLSLGLVLGVLALSGFFAYPNGAGFGAWLPLSTPEGLPVELRVAVQQGDELQFVARDLVAPGIGDVLGWILVATSTLALLAGLVSSLSRELGRMAFGLLALLAGVGGFYLLSQIGVQATPSPEQQLAQVEASGIPADLVMQGPLLSSQELVLHPATVTPLLFIFWLILCVAGWRAFAPMGAARDDRIAGSVDGFVVSRPLAASRDSALMGTIMLWLAVATGLFASYELGGRYVASHAVSGYFALAALALASVSGWHAALGRSTRSAFGSWVVLPTITLVVAGLVLVSGLFTADALGFLTVVP